MRLFLLAALILAAALPAATFTVTNLTDSGAGSLRQAMLDAEATGASDVIVFQSGLTGTITLATALPAITTPLIINNGDPLEIEVSGNNAVTVFQCYDGATLDIRGLTISNGFAATTGGAIYVFASVTSATFSLDRCIVRDSAAQSGAAAYLLSSGSAICYATFSNCTFTGNSATGGGGGLRAEGAVVDLTCMNCTFSGNDSATQGGALWYGCTSAIDCYLAHCTFTGNQAATGGALFRNNGVVVLASCIVADNLGPSGSPDGSGLFYSASYNLIGNATGMTIAAEIDDQFGSAGTPIDPLLLALADNGGPTPTHALLTSSPAVDAGDPTPLVSSDQRGFPRVDTPDCGAFELQPPQLEVSQVSPIADGATIYLTGTSAPGAGRDETFTIQNLGIVGEKNLLITSVFTNVPGNCTASVSTSPASPVVPGASASMVVTITPTAAGLYYFDLYIESNDPTTQLYQITVIGFASSDGSSSGGDKGDEGGCSTGGGTSSWLLLAGLAGVLLMAVRNASRGLGE